MSAGYMRRCAQKKRFETKAEASEARASLAADSSAPVSVYLCDQCLGFHVGRAGGRFKTRNRTGKRPNKRMRGRQ
jgi:hypothetical protein